MKTVLREIYGLFVDDVFFAVAILLWLGAMWWMVAHFAGRLSPWLEAVLLFAGLAAVLLESTLRYARGHRFP